MRRRPGSAPTSAANGPGGDHAPKASPGRWPPATSSSAAQSRTLRVIHPSCAMPDTLSESITWGPCETRPRVGFSPTTPHLAAGSRTEPPPSLPWATGTRPAATAAAAPPLDPPVEREVSHGLRHGPQPADSVVATSAISEVLERPASTNPAARIAWTK